MILLGLLDKESWDGRNM